MRYLLFVCLLCALTALTCSRIRTKDRATTSGIPQYECSPLLDETLVKKLETGVLPLEHKKPRSFTMPSSVHYGRISKEFFRCRGSTLHSPIAILKEGKVIENIFDCGGSTSHSLPIRDGHEYIYPILIDLLNRIQQKTHKQVVITSGHRCPQHNRYVTARGAISSAKHMIGAAVDFYVVGLERAPEQILKIIFEYFTQYTVSEKEKKAYTDWKKSEKDGGWYNKEVYVKWHKEKEGRDLDNAHPFPYFSLHVRFDREKNKEVVCTPHEAREMYQF